MGRLDPSLSDVQVAKEFLQITHEASDTVIGIAVDAAFEFVQEECAILVNAAAAAREDYVEGGGYNLWVPYGPLLSVSEVYDSVGEVVLDSDTYDVLPRRQIRRHGGIRWNDGAGRYKVTYVAGYTNANLPATLKLAVLGLVERAYRNPGGKASESGAGHSWTWQDLSGSRDSGVSDILEILDRYSMRGIAG